MTDNLVASFHAAPKGPLRHKSFENQKTAIFLRYNRNFDEKIKSSELDRIEFIWWKTHIHGNNLFTLITDAN